MLANSCYEPSPTAVVLGAKAALGMVITLESLKPQTCGHQVKFSAVRPPSGFKDSTERGAGKESRNGAGRCMKLETDVGLRRASLGFTKRRPVSAACSAAGCGFIAFCVWACGRGDIAGLFYLVISVSLAAIVGGLAGLVFASAMRGRKGLAEEEPTGAQNALPGEHSPGAQDKAPPASSCS
jgi:hypothetical protein